MSETALQKPAYPFDFKNHRAIVTGAAQGIGHAIAEALKECGCDVIGFDVVLPENKPGFRLEKLDITDADAVHKAVGALSPSADLLVNNAGITRDRSLGKMTDDEWKQVIDVNLTGAFNMLRAASIAMKENGYGRIVNITSINGMRGKFGQANYTAAKAGLIGLSKTAARELGAKGITVNAVAPGMVMTEMAKKLPEDILAKARTETVVPRLSTPEDIAYGVLFLLSDGAATITGQVLKIDGGQYI